VVRNTNERDGDGGSGDGDGGSGDGGGGNGGGGNGGSRTRGVMSMRVYIIMVRRVGTHLLRGQ